MDLKKRLENIESQLLPKRDRGEIIVEFIGRDKDGKLICTGGIVVPLAGSSEVQREFTQEEIEDENKRLVEAKRGMNTMNESTGTMPEPATERIG